MNERQLVEHIRARAVRKHKGLILGIGDDTAVYRPSSDEDLLLTTDLMVEGVHFLPTAKPEFIGRKAIARGLSDIAAMGGTPQCVLVSLAVPPRRTRFVTRFYDGLLEIADRYKVALAGGDLSRSNSVTCDIVVVGSVSRGSALRRDTARAGDAIWVSGTLGRAALRRYREVPEPRLELGRKLLGRASACMDLSDGLSIDLQRLCEASGLSAELESVPVEFGATLDQALHGGEDYELLFTARPDLTFAGCHRVGRMVRSRTPGVSLHGEPLPVGGHDHFGAKLKGR